MGYVGLPSGVIRNSVVRVTIARVTPYVPVTRELLDLQTALQVLYDVLEHARMNVSVTDFRATSSKAPNKCIM